MAQKRVSTPAARNQASSAMGRLIPRMFVVADYAAVAPDQKLYLGGANITWQGLPNIPGPAGQLYLALILGVPWNLASEPHHLRIRLLDADRQPVGPDPILDGQGETGRPPGSRAGDELTLALALNITGIPVKTEGAVYFHLLVNDVELAILPFGFRRAPIVTIAPLEADS